MLPRCSRDLHNAKSPAAQAAQLCPTLPNGTVLARALTTKDRGNIKTAEYVVLRLHTVVWGRHGSDDASEEDVVLCFKQPVRLMDVMHV